LLQGLLGRGAMGEVYRAVDTRTRGVLAVKLLSDSAQGNPLLLRALWREVRAVARMHHPNVVQVVDYGKSDEGNPFFVMEYVPGLSLEAMRSRISVKDLLEITDGILAGLGYAHARGVVHRDLKPENVIIVEREDGSLQSKLVDFGVAQIGGLRHEPGATGHGRAIAENVVGTPAYMAPEQAQGMTREIGAESDLYALGILLYEFIGGRLPFDAPNPLSILLQHVNAEPPPLVVPNTVSIPEGLETLIMGLLAKHPWERPSFAADVRRSLRALDWSQASDTPEQQLETSDSLSAILSPDLEVLSLTHTLDSGTMQAKLSGEELFATDGDAAMSTLFEAATLREDESEAPSTGLFGVREVPLIGREREKQQLWSAFEQMLEDQNIHLVVLSGPAGVGKSRLGRWLMERAEEHGLAQAMGCGVGPGSVFATGGMRGLLERHLRIHGLERDECVGPVERRLVEPGHFEPSELRPLMEYFRPTLPGDSMHSSAVFEPAAVAARVLRAATTKRPVALIFDDLRGPDVPEFLDLIELLEASRQISPMPVLILVTLTGGKRTAAESERHTEESLDTLAKLLELAPQDALHLSLEPMSSTDTITLAKTVLPVSEALAALVADRSSGNPQYAIQLLSHWMDSEGLVEDAEGCLELADASMNIRRLPRGLSELLTTRLGTILSATGSPALARAVLGRAALCGHRFPVNLIERLFEWEGRQDLDAIFDSLLEALIVEGYWLEVDEGVIQFARADHHEAVSEHLISHAEQVEVHSILARLELELFAHDLGRWRGEIARHFEAAGSYDEACTHLLEAAKQAFTWAQYPAARSAFEGVKRLIETHSVVAAVGLADEADLGLALTNLKTGAYDAAEENIVSVRQRGRAASRRHAVARATLLQGEVAYRRGELEQAIQVYEFAKAEFEELGQTHGVARTMRALAEVYVSLQANASEIAPMAHLARVLFETLGDTLQSAQCLMIEGKGARMTGRREEAVELYRAAERSFEKVGARHGVLEARLWHAEAVLATGRLDEAEALYQELVEPLGELGDPRNIIYCFRGLGIISRKRGHFEASEAANLRALAVATAVGDDLSMAQASTGLGEVSRARGQWDSALSHYQTALGAAIRLKATGSQAIAHANMGLMYVQQKKWREAVGHLVEAVDLARKTSNLQMLGAFLGCLARAWGELESWGVVEDILTEVLFLDEELKLTEPDFLASLEALAMRSKDTRPDIAVTSARVVRNRALATNDSAMMSRISGLLVELGM